MCFGRCKVQERRLLAGTGRGSDAELKGPCAQSHCPGSDSGPDFLLLPNADQHRSKAGNEKMRATEARSVSSDVFS